MRFQTIAPSSAQRIGRHRNDLEVDDSFADGGGDRRPHERAGEIEKRRHCDRLTRSQDAGGYDSCDRVGGVVEAVDVFEDQGRQDDDKEEKHAGTR